MKPKLPSFLKSLWTMPIVVIFLGIAFLILNFESDPTSLGSNNFSATLTNSNNEIKAQFKTSESEISFSLSNAKAKNRERDHRGHY